MSSIYFRNNMGFTLTDDQLRIITHPRLELGAHVVLKNIQTFGIIGGVVVGPATALWRPETRNWKSVEQSITRYGQKGLGIGCVAGSLMSIAAFAVLDKERIYDQCYRLRNSRSQVRVDQASVVGAVVGSGIYLALNKDWVTGGIIGMSAGVLGMAVLNNLVF